MNRQQQRLHAIDCVRNRIKPTVVLVPSFKWRLLTDIFDGRLVGKTPLEVVENITANRAFFGEVIIAMYDLNVKGFACVESAKGELYIAALCEVLK